MNLKRFEPEGYRIILLPGIHLKWVDNGASPCSLPKWPLSTRLSFSEDWSGSARSQTECSTCRQVSEQGRADKSMVHPQGPLRGHLRKVRNWENEKGGMTKGGIGKSSFSLLLWKCTQMFDWSACKAPGNKTTETKTRLPDARPFFARAVIGWHYLSNATCLTRPRLLYASFMVSWVAVTCYIIRRHWRKPALQWFSVALSFIT